MRLFDVVGGANGRAVAALALLMAVAACKSGNGRPPALQGTPSGSSGSSAGRIPPPIEADTRPDVDRLANEGAYGSDLSMPGADMSTEGGPLADVHFDLDSAALNEAAQATLAAHAVWLKSHAGARVTVEGHCDERGTTDYNLALGEQRARAARDYLVGLGISANRLQAVSFGKEKPVDTSSNEEAWARNRRAHFVVAGG